MLAAVPGPAGAAGMHAWSSRVVFIVCRRLMKLHAFLCSSTLLGVHTKEQQGLSGVRLTVNVQGRFGDRGVLDWCVLQRWALVCTRQACCRCCHDNFVSASKPAGFL